MPRDTVETLRLLVARANAKASDEDEEARTAAVKACELLARHPELVASTSDGVMIGAPQRRSVASALHEDAERWRDWRAMVRDKKLLERPAIRDAVCADCGKPIEQGAPIVELRGEDIVTHHECAGWWWNYQPP